VNAKRRTRKRRKRWRDDSNESLSKGSRHQVRVEKALFLTNDLMIQQRFECDIDVLVQPLQR
jgi:hypothetical protein